MPGFWEILIITLVIFALFGAKRLPEIARSIGKGINEFKKTKDEINEPLFVDDSTKEHEEKEIGKDPRSPK